MADQWFYETNGKQVGPVDKDTLQILVDKGVVQHQTLVWREGLSEWVPASRIKGLISGPPPIAKPAGPPPLPAHAAAPQPMSPSEAAAELVSAPDQHTATAVAAPPAMKPVIRAAKAGPVLKRPSGAHDVRAHHDKPKAAKASAMPLMIFAGVVICVIAGIAIVVFKEDGADKKLQQIAQAKEDDKKKEDESKAKRAKEEAEAAKNRPPTDPKALKNWLLDKYDAMVKATPEKWTDLNTKLEEMAGQFEDDSKWFQAVKQRKDSLRNNRERKAEEAASKLEGEAKQLISGGKYKDAVEALKKFPEELDNTDASMRIFKMRSDLDKEALKQLAGSEADAKAAMEKGDFKAASAVFDKLSTYGHPEIARRVTMYRAEIADAGTRGINPSAGKNVTVEERFEYMKADRYIAVGDMVKRYTQAVTFVMMGNAGDASGLVTVKDYPRSCMAYYIDGMAALKEGNSDKAEFAFEQAKRLALPNEAFISRLTSAEAEIAVHQYSTDAAEQKINKALEMDPKNAHAFYARAMLFATISELYGRLTDNKDIAKDLRGRALEAMKAAAGIDEGYRQFVDEFQVAEKEEKYNVKGTANPYLTAVVHIIGNKGAGTGWCIKNDGTTKNYIITNNHVVEGNTTFNCVYQVEAVGNLVKRESTKFKILKTNAIHDLAVCELITEVPMKVLPIRQTVAGLRVPMPVTLIGNPGGGGKSLDFTVMSGELSNLGRNSSPRRLQINANVEHGMSGGPVIDEKGNVIGVTVSKFVGIAGQGQAVITEHVRDLCKEANVDVKLVEN